MQTAADAAADRTPRAEMSALVLEAPGTISEQRMVTPAPRPGHYLVEIGLLGLCGTDLGFYDGSSNYLADGLKSFPFVFGHEWSGRVVGIGAGGTRFALGQRVSGHNFRPCGRCASCSRGTPRYCPQRSEIGVLGAEPGAAADYLEVPEDSLIGLPDPVGDAAAVLLEPGSAAVHAVRRLEITGEDRVAVLGAGTLGLVAAQVCAGLGARVAVFDPQHGPRELAAELGIAEVGAPQQAAPDAYSAVIEASGAVAAVRGAPELCAPGGRIAQLGTPHHAIDGFPAATLVVKNVTLHAVLSGIGYWADMLEFVEKRLLRLEPLVDSIHSRSEVGAAFGQLAASGRRRPKILLRMNAR